LHVHLLYRGYEPRSGSNPLDDCHLHLNHA
jgi:hypothetical protein